MQGMLTRARAANRQIRLLRKTSRREPVQGGFTRLDALLLLLTAVFGLAHIPSGFFSDQALFAVGARMMDRGAVMYRDFWDIKQPGIYGFYWLGGRLFGFNDVGIHAFELLYLLVLAALCLRILRGYFHRRWALSLVPLLTVGMYYAVSGDLHLTQVEGLVGAPLLISCWGAAQASERERGWRYLLLSGVAGGVVVLFKLVLAPILAGFWLVVLLYRTRLWRQNPLRAAVETVLPIAAGVLVPVLPVCAYFFHKQMLGVLYYATFSYPVEVARAMTGPGWGRLFHSALWFVRSFAPLIAFGFLGAALSLKRSRDAMTACLTAWVVCAFGVIAMQYLSWWEYHFMLLFLPVGILGAKGIEYLWEQITRESDTSASRALAATTIALLFLPALMGMSWKTAMLARHHFAFTAERRSAYHACINPKYRGWERSAEFARRDANGTVFVFGEPVLYQMSGRDPALSATTPDGQVMTPKAWAQLDEELKQKLPMYVFVQETSDEYDLRLHSPETLALIQSRYHAVHACQLGTWYRRNGVESIAGAGIPGGGKTER